MPDQCPRQLPGGLFLSFAFTAWFLSHTWQCPVLTPSSAQGPHGVRESTLCCSAVFLATVLTHSPVIVSGLRVPQQCSAAPTSWMVDVAVYGGQQGHPSRTGGLQGRSK